MPCRYAFWTLSCNGRSISRGTQYKGSKKWLRWCCINPSIDKWCPHSYHSTNRLMYWPTSSKSLFLSLKLSIPSSTSITRKSENWKRTPGHTGHVSIPDCLPNYFPPIGYRMIFATCLKTLGFQIPQDTVCSSSNFFGKREKKNTH